MKIFTNGEALVQHNTPPLISGHPNLITIVDPDSDSCRLMCPSENSEWVAQNLAESWRLDANLCRRTREVDITSETCD